MKLSYINRKLEKSVATFSAIATNYGTLAKLVNQRKKDLESSPSLDTMRTLGGNCHELRENRKGQLSVSISGNHRIVFIPSHNPVPTKEDGGLDWKQVTEITILEIGIDYH